MERTLILVKPDAFARGLTGEIVARFERKGLRIVAMRHMQVTEDLAKQHYAEHDGKPFFGELVEFITSGPIVAMVLEGEQAIKAARQVIGATNPLEATTGSIRGDFAIAVGQNMVHGSDSPESGEREAKLFFPASLAPPRPQRRAILEQLGVAFEVAPGGRRGADAAGDPRARGARERAPQGARGRPGELVLGADTDVALDGEMLGKPRDAGHARELLARLAGRRHEVVGGIAIAEHGAITAQDVVVTAVDFRALDPATLDWYVATGEWQGRAGGYAIQGRGAALVAGIEGDYLNVVGLPLARLLDLRASSLLPGPLRARLRSAGSMPGGPSRSMPCSAARRPRRSTSGASRSGSSRRGAGTP